MMPDSSRLRTRRRHGGAVRPTFSESATFVVRPSSCNVRRMSRSIGSRTAVPAMLFHLVRSEEHTSELQSLMRISYAVFCLKKKNIQLRSARINMYTIKKTIQYDQTTTH